MLKYASPFFIISELKHSQYIEILALFSGNKEEKVKIVVNH